MLKNYGELKIGPWYVNLAFRHDQFIVTVDRPSEVGGENFEPTEKMVSYRASDDISYRFSRAMNFLEDTIEEIIYYQVDVSGFYELDGPHYPGNYEPMEWRVLNIETSDTITDLSIKIVYKEQEKELFDQLMNGLRKVTEQESKRK